MYIFFIFVIIENYLDHIRNVAMNITADNDLMNNIASKRTDKTAIINKMRTLMAASYDDIYSIFLYDINEDKVLSIEEVVMGEKYLQLIRDKSSSGKFYFVYDKSNKLSLMVYPGIVREGFFGQELAFFSVNANLHYMKNKIVPVKYSKKSLMFILSSDRLVIFGSDYNNLSKDSDSIKFMPDYAYSETSIKETDESLHIWEKGELNATPKHQLDGYDLLKYANKEKDEHSIDIVNGIKYIVLNVKSYKYDWVLIQYIPLKDIFKGVRKIKNLLLAVTVIFMIMSLSLAYYLSNQLTKPIFNLKSMMENCKLGKKDNYCHSRCIIDP
jgi:hypothetical protein